jgi:hypothetical protein
MRRAVTGGGARAHGHISLAPGNFPAAHGVCPLREAMETMAATMLTPGEMPTDNVSAPQSFAATVSRQWRRVPFQLNRRTVGPWLGIKAVLTALVFLGQMGVWTAFAVDTAVSLAVVVRGWRAARR